MAKSNTDKVSQKTEEKLCPKDKWSLRDVPYIEGTLDSGFLVDEDGDKLSLDSKMLLHVLYGNGWRTSHFDKGMVASDRGICQDGDKIRIINKEYRK